MDKQQAQVALQFLQRVTLQPSEIQAWQLCCQALQQIVQPMAVVPTDQADTPDEAA